MTAAGVHAATTAQVQRPADCIQRLYMPRSFRSVWCILALPTCACLTEQIRSALMAVPGACQVLCLSVAPGSRPCASGTVLLVLCLCVVQGHNVMGVSARQVHL